MIIVWTKFTLRLLVTVIGAIVWIWWATTGHQQHISAMLFLEAAALSPVYGVAIICFRASLMDLFVITHWYFEWPELDGNFVYADA